MAKDGFEEHDREPGAVRQETKRLERKPPPPTAAVPGASPEQRADLRRRWSKTVEHDAKRAAARRDSLRETPATNDTVVKERLKMLETRLGDVPARFRALVQAGATIRELVEAIEKRLGDAAPEEAERLRRWLSFLRAAVAGGAGTPPP